MKQKDLALIAMMVIIGAVFSLIVSRMIFSSPKSRSQTAEVVDTITPGFSQPSSKYFGVNAIDPTAHIQVPQSADSGANGAKP